jgi:precorrin-6Y C5,15-methyltransferase (decarboxylating)
VIEVVGMGADGWDSLASAERELVRSADLVLGGRRHLHLLPDVPGQRRIPLPADLRAGLPELVDQAMASVVVLASGDPLFAGIGSTLIDLLGPASVRIHPALSSVALARARMGWPADTVEVIRLRGDDLDIVRRALFPGRRLLVLSRDAATPDQVAQLLTDAGFGASTLTVLSDLGAPTEARLTGRADTWPGSTHALTVVAIECPPTVQGSWSLVPGLPDEAFDHDGQLTKRNLRASALAHLQPRPGELLWDVGAGAGSVAIEWLRAHPSCRAVAIERDADRAKRITANARALGVPALSVVLGAAPAVLVSLPTPQAVFVGGGATAETLDQCWQRLAPGGRLVVHAVTHETELVIDAAWHRHGGELTRISVEHLERIGTYHGWNPARAIVQWSVVKSAG